MVFSHTLRPMSQFVPFYGLVVLLLVTVQHTPAAADTCPGSVDAGKCVWPKQQAYRNVSVASSQNFAVACCQACFDDARCMSWFVRTDQKGNIPAGTCIMNDAVVKGGPPPAPQCSSGTTGRTPNPNPWPPRPPPSPAPPKAKNVLFFAVDDLRPEINAFGGAEAIPGAFALKLVSHFRGWR